MLLLYICKTILKPNHVIERKVHMSSIKEQIETIFVKFQTRLLKILQTQWITQSKYVYVKKGTLVWCTFFNSNSE